MTRHALIGRDQSGKGGGEPTHDLEFDSLSLKLNSSNLEVYTNCADVALCVRVIRKTEQQAGLGRK